MGGILELATFVLIMLRVLPTASCWAALWHLRCVCMLAMKERERTRVAATVGVEEAAEFSRKATQHTKQLQDSRRAEQMERKELTWKFKVRVYVWLTTTPHGGCGRS